MIPVRFGFAATLFAALTITAPVFGAGGEDSDDSASPGSTLDLAYDLYVGGISLGKVSMSARFDGGDYKAVSTLETKGVVNALWQSKIEASSSGLVTQGKVQPTLYDSFSQNRSVQRRHATLTFGPDGPKSLESDPPYEDNRYPVSDAQRKKTLDPLSAAVYLTSSPLVSQGKPCQAVAPVFDGRRRYDLEFSYVKNTNIHMDNGLYSGPAAVCEVHFKQIAGYQQSVIEQNKFPKMFAWVVSTKSVSDPTKSYNLPLRVWAETEFGIVAAVASQVKLDGRPLGHSS